MKAFYPLFACIFLLSTACQKANNYSNRTFEVVKEWKLTMLSANELHTASAVADSAAFHLLLTTENSLRFDISIDSLQKAGEQLTGLTINAGNPVQDGLIVLDLKPRVISAYASGVIYDLRPGFIDSLKNDEVDLYVNAISSKTPSGLLRQQLNHPTILTANVLLTGAKVVPAVTTTSSATGYLRVTKNEKLYSLFKESNPETTDPLTGAGIYAGPAGANGTLIGGLAATAAEVSTPQLLPLAPAQLASIMSGSSYVQVSSANFPNGKMRGQVK